MVLPHESAEGRPYKTVSLKTTDIGAAHERAFDQDADVRFRIKHDVPVFNHPFCEVAYEYLLTQEARATRGEISAARPKKLRAVIGGTLDRYAGSTQVHLIGDERWGGYPAGRRENGAGRHRRNGVREITATAAQTFADHEAERRTKVQQTLGIRVLKPLKSNLLMNGWFRLLATPPFASRCRSSGR